MEFEIPYNLQKAVKNKKLIVFAGAGLSKDKGLPTWNTIIEKILKSPEFEEKKAKALIQNLNLELMTPLEVLEKIEDEKNLILEHFENSLNIDDLSSEIHKKLATVTKKFVTTNFDKLIEANSNIKTVITHDSDYHLQKIGKKDDLVIKLHGDISTPDKCIIFKDQYDKLYNNDELAPFKLKSLLADYTFLFVGFSFTDPYVNELFSYMSRLLKGYSPKHYLLSTSDKELENIDTINIGSYDNLSNFIDQLAKSKTTKTKEIKKEDRDEEDSTLEEDGSDIAPNVSNWVGRKTELTTLYNTQFKVIFITGFGGVGKSALASHFLNETNMFELEDWRDFKEEDHKFQTKIISMILKVDPNAKEKKLVGLTNEKLIKRFFNKLGDKKALFVLDNVDSYIDFEKREPIGHIAKFFDAALKYEHNAQFIFTCRPFIMYSGINFYHLRLTGLELEDAIEFFYKGNTIIKRDRLLEHVNRAHRLTKGHTIWLSFILAQSKKGEDTLINLLDKIESGEKPIDGDESAYLSKKLLGNMWDMLGNNEKTILRVLAEAVYSESIDNYARLLDREMNYKKFTKAYKNLLSLDLIIVKRNTKFIELHPLVKEFIRSNYIFEERKKYISMFIHYYDSLLVMLKNKISHTSKYEDFIKFTKKTEVSINAGEYQKAIDSLDLIRIPMISAGYIEEFLRVSKLLLNSIDWNIETIESYTNFIDLYRMITKCFAEYGELDYANTLIEKFNNIIEHKSENYIMLCEVKAYIYWINNNLDEAINTCEEALYLIKRAEQEDKYDMKHSYFLALRDTKEIDKVKKSLEYFLLTNTLEELVSDNTTSKDIRAATYGNVGKCLLNIKDYEGALICCFKSFFKLYNYSDYQRLLNLGYAALWIAEVYLEQEEYEKAYYFLRYAKDCWQEVSPVLYNQNIDTFNLLIENGKKILEKDKWRIDEFCTELIEKSLDVKFKAAK